MTALIDRVKTLLSERGESQSSFARRINVSPQTLSAWLSKRNKPDIDAVIKMCEALTVSPSWLLTGREDDIAHQSIVSAEIVAIPMYDVWASCGGGSKVETACVVRLLEASKSWVLRHCGTANLRSLNVICIVGDSMEPTFKDGDLVIVDLSANRVFTDSIFAYSLGGDLYVKRFQRAGRNLNILSDNPRYPTVTLTPADMDDGFKVVGKVVSVLNVKTV